MTKQCQREDCDGDGNWRWWNGMGGFGPYCDSHAREQLDDSSSYKDPIQRIEDCSDGYVVPAGIVPADSTLPCIRTKEAFDIYLETDGQEPHQCDVGYCGNLARDCDHSDSTENGVTHG